MANREALDSLSTTKSVRIYWVPSHQGIETVDVLAKGGRRADERQNGERANLPSIATKRPGETGGHASKKQVEEYQDLPNLKNYVQRTQR